MLLICRNWVIPILLLHEVSSFSSLLFHTSTRRPSTTSSSSSSSCYVGRRRRRAAAAPSSSCCIIFMSVELEGDGDDDDDDDFEILFEESSASSSPPLPEQQQEEENLDIMEKAWRYAKKPLLSIGAKGATLTHGNSLRQLLDSHTIVKVKVNKNKFGTLEKAFEDIRTLAEESGAPKGIEMLQARDKDKIILFALPGTMERLENGDFPPPPTAASTSE